MATFKRKYVADNGSVEVPAKQPHYGNRSLSSDEDCDADVPGRLINHIGCADARSHVLIRTLAPKPGKGDIGLKLMRQMGYQEGTGLGKHSQGQVDVIATSTQKGRRGLGYTISDVHVDEQFEWSAEKEREFVSVREPIEWLGPCAEEPPTDMEKWPSYGMKKMTINDEVQFCDEDVVRGVLSCKEVFDQLSDHELRRARSSSKSP